VFLRVPALLVCLMVVAAVTLNLVLSPQRAGRLAVSLFASMSTGALSLDVRQFNLFKAIVAENIVIARGPAFDGLPLVTVQRVALSYNLCSVLMGRVNITGAVIDGVRVDLRHRQGRWNVQTIMNPGSEKTMSEQAAPGDDLLALPLPLGMSLNFLLRDLAVVVHGQRCRSSIEGVSLDLKAVTERFRSVPRSPAALDIVRSLEMTLNPRERVNLSHESPALAAKPPLLLSWKINYDRDRAASLTSSFTMSGSAPLRYRGSIVGPLDFLIGYDILCDPEKDTLELRRALVTFKGKTWLNITGSLSALASRPHLDLTLDRSEISLADVDPLVRALEIMPRGRLAGTLSLAPLTVRGTVDDLTVSGRINARDLFVKSGENSLTAPSALVSLEGRLSGHGPRAEVSLALSSFRYTIQGSPSGPGALSLNCRISGDRSFSRAALELMDARFTSADTGREALALRASGWAEPAHGRARIVVERLSFHRESFEGMVPGRYRHNIARIALNRPLSMTGDFFVSMKDDRVLADCTAGCMRQI
jgi:hypothetical protein